MSRNKKRHSRKFNAFHKSTRPPFPPTEDTRDLLWIDGPEDIPFVESFWSRQSPERDRVRWALTHPQSWWGLMNGPEPEQ